MNFALGYVVYRFFYRISQFLRHWYVDSFSVALHLIRGVIGTFDKRLALLITVRNLFKPLYRDKSVIGYFLGFIFRLLRMLVALSIYLILIVIGLVLYTLWLVVPAYIIYQLLFGYDIFA